MARLTDEVRQQSLWTVMFVDDIVVCNKSKEKLKGGRRGGGMQ